MLPLPFPPHLCPHIQYLSELWKTILEPFAYPGVIIIKKMCVFYSGKRPPPPLSFLEETFLFGMIAAAG